MEETWESLFIKQAKQKRHSQSYIDECLKYANRLHSQNLPVIFDLMHLAQYLEMSSSNLDYIISNSDRMYRSFDLEKGNSRGKRHINAPFPTLKAIQQWVNVFILCRDTNIHKCCQAFMPQDMLGKRDILTNAKPHVGCLWLLNMDLKDFFPNIKFQQVFSYFFSLGYEEDVARALSNLCCRDYRLPQGAPSSPMLANHIAKDMDDCIQAYCDTEGYSYTRYADDITISGKQDVNVRLLIKDIEAMIYINDFVVNRKKTKFRRRGNRQTVTGLTINNGVHVPKSYRKDILKELHCCQKFGASAHIRYRNEERRKALESNGVKAVDIRDLGFYRQWLLGRIMYVRSIEPTTGKKMLDEYNKISWIL